MKPRSLIITVHGPSRIYLGPVLLSDHGKLRLGGMPVEAGVAPWWPIHDLLFDPESRAFAGVVYQLMAHERAPAWGTCATLNSEVARYCISPGEAAVLLEVGDLPASAPRSGHEGTTADLRGFPEELKPVRQLLRCVLLGERARGELTREQSEMAARFFRETAHRVGDWPGGDYHRIEVTWFYRSAVPGLPSWCPARLLVLPVQQFAEDIWYYSEGDGKQGGRNIVAFGYNYVDKALEEHGLCFPDQPMFPALAVDGR